nr:hypothetical protein [Rhodococcus sp. (in: high G+C Gram-positive bacteria)]
MKIGQTIMLELGQPGMQGAIWKEADNVFGWQLLDKGASAMMGAVRSFEEAFFIFKDVRSVTTE